MASSGKKPGIKDISDLKARLGLTKPKAEPEAEEAKEADEGAEQAEAAEEAAPSGAAPAGSAPAADAAPAPAGQAPAGQAPAAQAPAGAAPAGAPPAGQAPAGQSPAGQPPAGAAPAGAPAAAPAGNPLGGGAPAGNPLASGAPAPQAQAGGLALQQQQQQAPAAGAPPEEEYEEEYEDEEESYDYEPPPVPEGPAYDPNQFDPNIKQPRSVAKMAVIGAIVLIVGVAAFFMGKALTEILHDRETVNRRINVAKDLLSTVEPKVKAFNEFIKPFKEKAEAGGGMPAAAAYDKALFEHIEGFSQLDFVLDPSSDIPSEAIVLGQNAENNPLPELRQYSYGTLILQQLLGAHVKATRGDKTEIKRLIENAGESPVMAVFFDSVSYFELLDSKGVDEETGTLNPKARTIKGIYPVAQIYTKMEEATPHWKKIVERMPDAVKKELPETPPRAIYELQGKDGNPIFAAPNEILLAERSQIVGASDNALQRYKERMNGILKIIVEVEKAGEALVSKLEAQASEEPI